MVSHSNLHHRRAVAAAQRRAPLPVPQLGFDPTAIFGGQVTGIFGPGRPGGIGGGDNIPTGLVPPLLPTDDDLPLTPTDTNTDTNTSAPSTLPTTATGTTGTPTTNTAAPTPTPPPVNPAGGGSTEIVTGRTQTTVVIQTNSRTSSTSRSSSTSTGIAEASTGMSTGAVVGGIGAGIVAIAAIGFAVAFFIRRSRKRETDGNNFDTQDFRRSAMLLNDPPTHDDTVARGFNPRPPVMAEHRHASPAPTFGTQYGAPGPAYNYDNDYPGGNSENRAGYGSQYPAYGPGQVMYNGVPSPNTASSTQPMFPVALHNQSPFSPIGAPSSPHGHYDEQQQYYENQGLSRQPSMGANLNRQPSAPAGYPVLTRQQSAHSSADAHYRQEHANAALGRESAPVNDYVDLNRSSVSPYQAAQYVEISRRLNTQVPEGLHTPEIDRELPPLPPKPEGISPFADPASAPPSPGGQYAIDRRNLNPSPRPLSGDSIASAASQTLEFPAPPSPAHTAHSRYRVDSTPPTLPEIHLESRVSMGLRNSGALSPLGSGFPSGLGAGAVAIGGTRFPATPSPLASSFGMPSTPGSNRNTFGAVVTAPPPMPASHAAPATQSAHDEVKFEKKRGTMYSVYDDEDAYGGI